MSAGASRAELLAAPLTLPPVAPTPVAPASVDRLSVTVSATTQSAVGAVAAPADDGAADGATDTVATTQDANVPAPTVPAKDTTAAQQFAAKAAAAPASTADQATTAAPASVEMPVLTGRPGTVAHTATPVMPAQSPANAGSIGGAVVALVMVVGLILALGWIAKRLPGMRGTSANGALRVVSQLTLGPRERVVVVAVGETQLLIGVGAGGMRTLHTLEQPLPVAAPAATPAFAQLLAQHFGKKA